MSPCIWILGTRKHEKTEIVKKFLRFRKKTLVPQFCRFQKILVCKCSILYIENLHARIFENLQYRGTRVFFREPNWAEQVSQNGIFHYMKSGYQGFGIFDPGIKFPTPFNISHTYLDASYSTTNFRPMLQSNATLSLNRVIYLKDFRTLFYSFLS